ncbi:MAG: MBL fold metallo-hydrolase [Candidatus Sulfopaludibacter sp.]|nr:MBL fold metallo-hydrolase [Candidatus Sulfopaludibacter sp.]
MIEDLQITILADNAIFNRDLLAEHGLAILVEAGGRRILFDTGQGRVLTANAAALGCALETLDAIVLSHGHYDHTGGIAQVLQLGGKPRIFAHPAALGPKFAKRGQPPHRDIGMPDASREALGSAGDRLVTTESVTEVAPGVWCTGEIPRTHAAESGFFLDPACRELDPLIDDQALFVETCDGIVVITGCAHAGLVDTLDRVAQITGQDRIFAVAGGFHLMLSERDAWEAAGNALGRREVQWIAPVHCTGFGAQAYLHARFHSRAIEAGAGRRLEFRKGAHRPAN